MRYLLRGSVQAAGPRLRVTAQLIEGETGHHIWAEHHDGSLEDVFALQDAIAEKVAGALHPSIRSAEIARARRKPPGNLRSYDYVLRAYPHIWAHRREDNAKALELLGAALALDPDYGLAAALAAWCHAQQIVYLWSADIEDDRARSLALVDRAAKLIDDDPMALTAMGAALTLGARDYDRALGFIERALGVDPNNAWAWTRGGFLHAYRGDHETAIHHFQQAMRLSPLDPFRFNSYLGMGTAHFLARDFSEAAEWVQRSIADRPGMTWGYRFLSACLAQAGDIERAREALAALQRADPEVSVAKVAAALPPLLPQMMSDYLDGLRAAGLRET